MKPFPHTRSPAPSKQLLIVALCAGALLVSGCDKIPSLPSPATPPTPSAESAAQPAAAVPVSAPATPTAPVYVPPGAEQLYQMVAPIALYPDKLVAQVLAGSTYPDQVTAADQWLGQNAALKAGPLADAAELQPWDPSIKSLTAFKPVLHQMASNLPWTTALGQAYYNAPDDVMNAIQVMRQRASKAGKLKSTKQFRVASGSAPAAGYAPDPNAPSYYSGPVIVEPPPQYITIEPAQADVVYVPSYDPSDIYGAPVAVYPGYAYASPVYAEPRYSNAQIATAGVLTFGTGVIVGAALQRHGWGWDSWGMNWGRPDAYRGGNRPPQATRGVDRPAVVYNRSTYVPRAREAVIHNNVRNNFVNNAGVPPPQRQPSQQLEQMRRQQAQALAQTPTPAAPLQQAQQAQRMQQRAQQEQVQRQQQAQRQGQQGPAQAQAQAQAAQRAQMRQQQQAQRDQQRQQQVQARGQQQRQQQQQQQQQQQAEQSRRQQAQGQQVQQQARQQQMQQRQQQQAQQNQARQQQQAQQVQARQQQDQARHQQQQQAQQVQQQARQQQRQQQMQQRQQQQQQQVQAQRPQQARPPGQRPPGERGRRPQDEPNR